MAGFDGAEMYLPWMWADCYHFHHLDRPQRPEGAEMLMHDLRREKERRIICQQEGGMSALDRQEGGRHYADMKIQPIEYIHANNLGFIEGAVIKYVSRYKNKNGLEDIRKAIHLLELLIELETKGDEK